MQETNEQSKEQKEDTAQKTSSMQGETKVNDKQTNKDRK